LGIRFIGNPADLYETASVKINVLWLYVTVGDALRMEVINSGNELPEAAFDLACGHAAFLDRCIEVTAGAILHNFAPALLIVLDKIDCLHNVDVMQSRGYTKLGCEFLDILLFCLVLAPLAELLDNVPLA
jgi:hypothetical protein